MYMGLDVHKKMSSYSMVDSQGTELKKFGSFKNLTKEPSTCTVSDRVSPTTEGK